MFEVQCQFGFQLINPLAETAITIIACLDIIAPAAADPVQEGTVTGKVSGATASVGDSGDSSGVRSAMKRKSSDPDPERGMCNSFEGQ